MARPSKIIAAIDELEATRGLLVKARVRLLQMEAVLKRNQFGCWGRGGEPDRCPDCGAAHPGPHQRACRIRDALRIEEWADSHQA